MQEIVAGCWSPLSLLSLLTSARYQHLRFAARTPMAPVCSEMTTRHRERWAKARSKG